MRKEGFSSQIFRDMALCNTGVVLQLSCKPRMMLISLEWGPGHQTLSGMYFMAAASISWLGVSVCQGCKTGCGGNRCLLLCLPWLGWLPAAFLLPDNLDYHLTRRCPACSVSPVPFSLWKTVIRRKVRMLLRWFALVFLFIFYFFLVQSLLPYTQGISETWHGPRTEILHVTHLGTGFSKLHFRLID